MFGINQTEQNLTKKKNYQNFNVNETMANLKQFIYYNFTLATMKG